MIGAKPERPPGTSEPLRPTLIVQKHKRSNSRSKIKQKFSSDVSGAKLSSAPCSEFTTSFNKSFTRGLEPRLNEKRNLLSAASLHENWTGTSLVLQAVRDSARALETEVTVEDGCRKTKSEIVATRNRPKIFQSFRFLIREVFNFTSALFKSSFRRVHKKYYATREDIRKMTINSPSVQRSVNLLHNPVPDQIGENLKLADKYFYDMAADPHWMSLQMACAIFLGLSRILWPSGVFYDQGQIDEIRGLVTQNGAKELRSGGSMKTPVIFLPLHKSHTDYLLFYLLFTLNDIPTPHTVAGDNLSKMYFLGTWLRQCNAFYIKRTHSNTNCSIYEAVLDEYRELGEFGRILLLYLARNLQLPISLNISSRC